MLIPPAIFFVLATLFLLGIKKDDGGAMQSAIIGRPPPEIIENPLPGYRLLKNEMIKTDEVILVNFWASWCPPCRAEHETLTEISNSGIAVYGVNFKDRADNAKRFLEEDGNPFAAITMDAEGRSGINWGVTGLPETFIIGRDGTIFYRLAGPLIEGNYTKQFLPQLKKALSKQ